MGVYIFGYSILCLLLAAIFLAIAIERHAAAAIAMFATLIGVALLAGYSGFAKATEATAATRSSLPQFTALDSGESASPEPVSDSR